MVIASVLTSFTRMPHQPRSLSAGDKPGGFLKNPSALHFLVASDNAQDIKAASIRLRQGFPGCRIEAVYSAQETREWAPQQPWHLILLDDALTRPPEQRLIADLKRSAPRTSLLVQTERNDVGVAMQALQAGADYCLFKLGSTFLTELPQVVERVLRRPERSAPSAAAMEQFLNWFEPQPLCVYELDEEGRFVYVSSPVEQLLGYQPQELVGQPSNVLLHPAESLQADRRLRERRTGGRATRNFVLRLAGRRANEGRTIETALELDSTGWYGTDGRFLGTLGCVRDPLAGRRRSSGQVTEAGVLAEFSGALVMDLQALLTAVVGYSDVLLQDLGPAGEIGRRRLEQLKAAGGVAADLARQLLIRGGAGAQPFSTEVNLASDVPRENSDRC